MERRIRNNFLILSMYKIFEMLMPMMTSPLLSRRLGVDALGYFTYKHCVVSMFVIFAELGCYRYGLREIAKVRNDTELLKRTYSDIFFAHFFNGTITFLFYFAYCFFFDQFDVYTIVLSCNIFSNMIDNAFLYVGLEKIGSLTVRDTAIKLITFVLIVVLIRNSSDLLVYTSVMSGSAVVCRIVAFIYSKKYCSLEKPKIHNCIKHYRPMAKLMIPALASVTYQSMDKIMIGAMYGNSATGYYECASKSLIPKNIITALGTVLCPQITNLYAIGRVDEAGEQFEKSFITSMILSFAFMFGISAVAPEFAPLFWGTGFEVCAPLLIGLSFSIPLWAIGEVIRNQYLLPVARDNEYTISFVMGVIVNAIINAMLIPFYGAMGAIIATLAAELTMSLVQIRLVRNNIPSLKYIVSTIPYFIVGIIMFAVVRMTATYVYSSLLTCVIVETICGMIIFLLGSVIVELITHKCYVTEMLFSLVGRGKLDG